TPLHAAARAETVSGLQLALFWGSEVNSVDCEGRSALMVAAENGQTSAVVSKSSESQSRWPSAKTSLVIFNLLVSRSSAALVFVAQSQSQEMRGTELIKAWSESKIPGTGLEFRPVGIFGMPLGEEENLHCLYCSVFSSRSMCTELLIPSDLSELWKSKRAHRCSTF
ncbi:serine/threonine-protein phosphatase 6 regulatory ankyrin repeat subunit C-like isoform X1, partial [Tachysurus ichikawai]